MSNEIILFQILYRHLEYVLFSLMKVRIVKFIQCGPYLINGPKFPKFSLLKTFYIVIRHNHGKVCQPKILVFLESIHKIYFNVLNP
jgi:hypothetical protein